VLALKKLEQEGFVEIIPQVGCTIKAPNISEARQSFLIRAILEGFACEVATENRTDADIKELQDIYQKSLVAAEKNDSKEYARCNQLFHTKIIEMSNMEQLISLVAKFWENIRYQAAALNFLLERHDTSIKEHGDIIVAMAQGDKLKARMVMETHVRECMDDFCSLLGANKKEPELTQE